MMARATTHQDAHRLMCCLARIVVLLSLCSCHQTPHYASGLQILSTCGQRIQWWRSLPRRSTITFASKTSIHDKHHDTGKGLIPEDLIYGLDLAPLIRGVARHTSTYRGHEALLSLVSEDAESTAGELGGRKGVDGISSRRQRAEASSFSHARQIRNHSRLVVAPLASSAGEARQLYELVEAASLSLSENSLNLTHPPLYGADSNPWDTSIVEDTDTDRWIDLPADCWTLENILQAEKTLETLLLTKEWAMEETSTTWISGLSYIGSAIDPNNILLDILTDCKGRVEIVKVRTLASPSGRASYSFRLKDDKYPVLKLLREKMDGLIKVGAKEYDKELQSLQGEIDEVEGQIRSGLAQLILSAAESIDHGLDLMARLDVIYAQAAFGLKTNGAFPQILNNGRVEVNKFVHPVLAFNDGISPDAKDGGAGYVVPIDLRLSNEQGQRVLIISGPNGGGKTLSMKSFGLVCVMAKLGIPIPVADTSPRPSVGFINDILINVGDKQDILHGESTWTSLLNFCSKMIETVQSNPSKNYLVLLDELGSGTDPVAGGAMGQAILEKLMSSTGCGIVTTTHSPRLKTLSYEDENYACATVMLEAAVTEQYRRPTFRLEYGVIGESFALGAAARCNPPLDHAVIARAAQLMEEESSVEGKRFHGDYFQALTRSMEVQVEKMLLKTEETAMEAHNALLCRQAMISLASSYELHLTRLNDRLEDCYSKLRGNPDKDDLEVIGDTLAEIKVAKKKVLSQKEILKTKGLAMLPPSYKLSVGESAVVVGTGSEWDGKTVEVVADSSIDGSLGATEILVQESNSFMAWDDRMLSFDNDPVADANDQQCVLQRHELAIWDYDSIWEGDSYDASMMQATSIPDSKRRLNSLLSTLKSDSPVEPPVDGSREASKAKKTYTSARARKAGHSKTKKRK